MKVQNNRKEDTNMIELLRTPVNQVRRYGYDPEAAGVQRFRQECLLAMRKGISLEELYARRALAAETRKERRMAYAIGKAFAKAYALQRGKELAPLKEVKRKRVITTTVSISVTELFD